MNPLKQRYQCQIVTLRSTVILTLHVFVKPAESKLELSAEKSIKAFLVVIYRSPLKPASFTFINPADAFI